MSSNGSAIRKSTCNVTHEIETNATVSNAAEHNQSSNALSAVDSVLWVALPSNANTPVSDVR